jgi:hypothetical protein
MTEQEWLECTDTHKMLHFVRDKGSDRKLRLFAVTCCRRVWTLLDDNTCKSSVEMVEKFCDGAITEKETADVVGRLHAHLAELKGDWPDPVDLVRRQAKTALDCWRSGAYIAAWEVAYSAQDLQANTASLPWDDWFSEQSQSQATFFKTKEDARSIQTQILREIIGNPFRPASIDPAWLTPTVVSLAQAAYDNRSLPTGTLDNARLAILADALEDADCTNADILNHCRQPGDHVRGCWVVDLVLGKE